MPAELPASAWREPVLADRAAAGSGDGGDDGCVVRPDRLLALGGLVSDRDDVRRVDRHLDLAAGEVGADEDVVDQLASALVDAAERLLGRKEAREVDEPPGIALVRPREV